MEKMANLSDVVTILINKKASCEYCRQLDAAIANLTPLVTNGQTSSPNGNGHATNPNTLIGSIISILEKHGGPMTPAEIIESLPATGYQSQAKTLRSVVYPVLNRKLEKGVLAKFGQKWGLCQWEKEGTMGK